MATDKSFTEYILDQIDDDKAHVRAMFGEYGLYYDKKVVGLICDNTLFLKITKSSSEILKGNSTGPAYPKAKASFIIDDEILNDKKLLRKIILGVHDDLPEKKNVVK